MTDLAPADLSTTLEPQTATDPSGGGAPRTIEEPAKEPAKVSLRDTIAAAVKDQPKGPDKDAEPADDKPAEKPKDDKAAPEAKEALKPSDRAPDGKFAAKQAEGDEPSPAEPKPDAEKPKSGHIEPPKNFLPDAKETWRNTPRAVQRDVENAFKQHETELTKAREATERYEPLRQYDELVRQNGRAGLHETLAEVAQLEDMMTANPLAALNQILLRSGPRKADGQPVSLFELAQFVVQSGQDGYNQIVSRQPAQQQQGQPNPEVEQLRQQITQMQEQQTAATVVEPFRAANPRYDELKPDIVFFLQSGKIPKSLSPSDRLAAAYDMAARINPASHDNDPASPTGPDPRAGESLSGNKSIKSAPGAVSTDMEPDRSGSIRDLLVQEAKRAKRS